MSPDVLSFANHEELPPFYVVRPDLQLTIDRDRRFKYVDVAHQFRAVVGRSSLEERRRGIQVSRHCGGVDRTRP